MANINHRVVIDLWVLLTLIVLIPRTILNSMGSQNSGMALSNIIYMLSGMVVFLIATFIYLCYCGKITKYRYLNIYMNCKKLPSIVKKLYTTTFVMVGIPCILLIAYYMNVMFIWYVLYIMWVYVLSIRFEEN